MAIAEDRLQRIISQKDVVDAAATCHRDGNVEGWKIVREVPGDPQSVDAALVVYDVDHPPAWLVPILQAEAVASRLEDEMDEDARARIAEARDAGNGTHAV